MDDNTNNERLLSRKELASFLKVSLPTVTQYVKDGCPIISKSRKVTGKGSRYCFEQGEVKRSAKGLARVLALNAGLGKATVRPDSYRIVWCYVGNPPDLDNLPSRCKAYLDSICAVLGMDDVKIEHMEVYRVHDKARAGYVFLAFGQWVETGSCGGCCRAEGGAPNLENIACEVCARAERVDFYEKEELV